MIIVFLGAPGAGKGTQASRLAVALGVPHVASGDLLRAVCAGAAGDSPLAREVRSYMDAGALVPDELTLRIVGERLAQPDAAAGAVLDGFPRTLTQAEQLDETLARGGQRGVDATIYIETSREVALGRMLARRRPDEPPEVQVTRYEVYERQTLPLVAYYEGRGVLARIDGEQPVEAVARDILAAVRARGAGPREHEGVATRAGE